MTLGTIQNHSLTERDPSLSVAMSATVLSTLGTAASIIFLVREQFREGAEANKQLIEAGTIPMPQGQSIENEKQVQALAEKWALVELLTSLGSKTRMASYPTAILITLLWLIKSTPGVNIKAVKASVQALSATAENLACTGFLGYQLSIGYPHAQKQLKKLAYESARTGKSVDPDRVLAIMTDVLSSAVASAFMIDKQNWAKERVFGKIGAAAISTVGGPMANGISGVAGGAGTVLGAGAKVVGTGLSYGWKGGELAARGVAAGIEKGVSTARPRVTGVASSVASGPVSTATGRITRTIGNALSREKKKSPPEVSNILAEFAAELNY